MILLAYILNNLLLFLYMIFGGIDFGIGVLVIIFLLKKYDLKSLFKTFNPLWEVNNVILIFFIVTFYFFFPKAINYYSLIFIIPAFLAFISLFIRTGSFTLLTFYKQRKGFYYAFGISSILISIFFSSYFLQILIPINNSSDLFLPTFFNIVFYLFVIISVLNLACGFLSALKNESKFNEQIINIYRVNYILWVIGFVTLIFYMFFNSSGEFTSFLFLLNLIIAFLCFFYVLFSSKNKSLLFLSALLPITISFFSIVLSQYPYFSNFTKISVLDSVTSQNVLNILIIVIVLGILISIPALVVFYKMFLKNELDYE